MTDPREGLRERVGEMLLRLTGHPTESKRLAHVMAVRDEIVRLAHLRAPEDEDLVDRLQLEAQLHATEARTANATIAEIYQIVSGATGEPGNWHGAEPVREAIDRLRDDLQTIDLALGIDDPEGKLDIVRTLDTIKALRAPLPDEEREAVRTRLGIPYDPEKGIDRHEAMWFRGDKLIREHFGLSETEGGEG